MKVSTEIDNNFGYEKITQLVDNIPLTRMYEILTRVDEILNRSHDISIHAQDMINPCA